MLILLLSPLQDLGHDVRDQDLDEKEAARLAAAKIAEGESHDRGWYRVNAIRGLSGGRKLTPKVLTSFQQVICYHFAIVFPLVLIFNVSVFIYLFGN